MKLMLILAAAVFVSAIAVVVSQHEARRTFVKVQELEAERDHLNEEWGRLQLEQSTWATDDRIEQLARTKLSMREPDAAVLVRLAP
jgi:cell division protein FtsL